jgi:hypothetical protein
MKKDKGLKHNYKDLKQREIMKKALLHLAKTDKISNGVVH